MSDSDTFRDLDAEFDERAMRFDRALDLVKRRRDLVKKRPGPREYGVREPEATAIDRLADRIDEIGPDAAYGEYLGGKW